MNNPFNENKENEKFQFFKGMTEAINDWMIKKYPSFDSLLETKIYEISRLQNEFKLLINDLQRDTRNKREKDAEEFKISIDKFIKKNYPEISHSIVDTTRKLKAHAKRLDEREKTQDEELINKVIQKVIKKLKKAFEDETEST